jgi:hypothetical protein
MLYSITSSARTSNEVARLLIDLAESNVPGPHPLSSSAKYARDLVIWRWRHWRQVQIESKLLASKTATLKAVEGATAEIKGIAEVWGAKILLNERTIQDRVCRKPKGAPRLQYWWQKE